MTNVRDLKNHSDVSVFISFYHELNNIIDKLLNIEKELEKMKNV